MSSILRKPWLAVIALAAPVLFGAEIGPKLTYEETEKFLQEAKIVSTKNLSTGVTNSHESPPQGCHARARRPCAVH